MLKYLVILSLLLFVGCVPVSAPTAADHVAGATGATPNPHFVATAQADQYWRDAEATSQAYQLTVAANYHSIEATALAATSTIQAQQTLSLIHI